VLKLFESRAERPWLKLEDLLEATTQAVAADPFRGKSAGSFFSPEHRSRAETTSGGRRLMLTLASIASDASTTPEQQTAVVRAAVDVIKLSAAPGSSAEYGVASAKNDVVATIAAAHAINSSEVDAELHNIAAWRGKEQEQPPAKRSRGAQP
jgi:hypothetical protein